MCSLHIRMETPFFLHRNMPCNMLQQTFTWLYCWALQLKLSRCQNRPRWPHPHTVPPELNFKPQWCCHFSVKRNCCTSFSFSKWTTAITDKTTDGSRQRECNFRHKRSQTYNIVYPVLCGRDEKHRHQGYNGGEGSQGGDNWHQLKGPREHTPRITSRSAPRNQGRKTEMEGQQRQIKMSAKETLDSLSIAILSHIHPLW